MTRQKKRIAGIVSALAGIALIVPGTNRTACAQSADEEPREHEVLAQGTAAELPVQKDTLSAADRARFELRATEVLGLQATTVQELDAVQVVQADRIALTLDGQQHVLELYPHSMRSDDFRVLEQDETGFVFEVAPPPITTYRGHLVGDITTDVAASIIDGKLYALIRSRDSAWAVQPVADGIAGAPTDLHAVFRVADVIPPAGACGVDDAFLARLAPPVEGDVGDVEVAESAGTGGRTQIAFDCDNEYYVANGSSSSATITDLEMVMNRVAWVYLGEFSPDICYVNEGVKVRTSEPDPYSSTDPDTLLCQFTDEWEASPPFSFDVAHLMTGKNLDGTTIGIAWVGVICGTTDFTNCAGPAQPLNFGLSWLTFSTNIVSLTALVAHEIGHNWNACHCNQNTCTGGAADADCGIMWSGTGTQQSSLLFGSRSTTTMNTHRNSRTCLSGCTGTTYVDGSYSGIETGSISFPYNTLEEGIDWVRVGGTVRIFSGSYPGTRTLRKHVNLEAHNGVVNMGN